MKYFDKYTSNTCASSGNQLYFSTEGKRCTGRVFYKIFKGGEYGYSLLFSNIIDSTYSDGDVSHKNLICGEWIIHSAKIGKCTYIHEDITDYGDISVSDFKDITFEGKSSKNVMPGEFFSTDPIKMEFKKGEYLCLEMTFSGTMLPYHEESLLPIYIKNGEKWEYNKKMPLPGMIGCDRPVKERVGYWGDSITQGIGSTPNSYLHWNSRLSEMIGEDYAYWNIGIGYGRANDAASGGAWMYKALKCDTLVVCFGVNDLCRQFTVEETKRDLNIIIDTLKSHGKRVILQTIPPFDYNEERNAKWVELNKYIHSELKCKVDYLYDCVPALWESSHMPHMAKYGGHPNDDGGRVWAEAMYEEIKDLF